MEIKRIVNQVYGLTDVDGRLVLLGQYVGLHQRDDATTEENVGKFVLQNNEITRWPMELVGSVGAEMRADFWRWRALYGRPGGLK